MLLSQVRPDGAEETEIGHKYADADGNGVKAKSTPVFELADYGGNAAAHEYASLHGVRPQIHHLGAQAGNTEDQEDDT